MKSRKYTKEDLVWEAVRRNQDYKDFYFKCINASCTGREISYERIEDTFSGFKGLRWMLDEDCVLNPNITVDNMKARIAAGSDPDYVNPYYRLFNTGTRKKPVIEIKPPKLTAIRHKNTSNGLRDAP